MTATLVAEAESLAREFARVYPTPNVLRGVALCEEGRIGWQEFAALCARSYGAAKAEVA